MIIHLFPIANAKRGVSWKFEGNTSLPIISNKRDSRDAHVVLLLLALYLYPISTHICAPTTWLLSAWRMAQGHSAQQPIALQICHYRIQVVAQKIVARDFKRHSDTLTRGLGL